MDIEAEVPREGLSRRDVLKRGAGLAGVALWAPPVLQRIEMTRGHAQVTSGDVVKTKKCYAVKIDKSSHGSFCSDIRKKDHDHGHGKGHGSSYKKGRGGGYGGYGGYGGGHDDNDNDTCLDLDDFDERPKSGGCSFIKSISTPKSGPWKIVLRQGHDFEGLVGFSYVKSGNKKSCVAGVYDPATRTFTFTPPRKKEISHVEFYFCVVIEGDLID